MAVVICRCFALIILLKSHHIHRATGIPCRQFLYRMTEDHFVRWTGIDQEAALRSPVQQFLAHRQELRQVIQIGQIENDARASQVGRLPETCHTPPMELASRAILQHSTLRQQGLFHISLCPALRNPPWLITVQP